MKIAGIDIPDKKRILIALTYIFGIGLSSSKEILENLKINTEIKTKDLSPEQVKQIQDYITNHIKIEGDLRREVNSNIARMISISCYRGIRHREGLPVRGQRSRNKGGKRRDSRRKKARAV